MAQTGSLTTKDLFRNDSGGWAGAVVLGIGGQHQGIAVEPDGQVWLSEEEQILTANAPQRDEDNPFVNGTFTKIGSGENVKSRRPYGGHAGAPRPDDGRLEGADSTQAAGAPAGADTDGTAPGETAVVPVPDDAPVLGRSAPGEEVGTPLPRRRRPGG